MGSYKKFFIKISLICLSIFLFSFYFFIIFYSGTEAKAQTVILAVDNTSPTTNDATPGANSSEGQQPPGEIAQVLSNWFPIVLSFIISILAITIPWSMASELVNLLKGGWNKLKGHTLGALRKTGTVATAQRAGVWGLKKIMENPRGRKIIESLGKRWRGREYAKAAWEDVMKETTQNIDYAVVLDHLKREGSLDRAPAVIQSLAKRIGGENIAKATEIAASQTPAAIKAQLDAIRGQGGKTVSDFLNALATAQDENSTAEERQTALQTLRAFSSADAQKIQQLVPALLQQSRNPNPEISTPAKEYLAQLRGTGITEGQLETADFRLFKMGQPISRPDMPIAQRPERQRDIKTLRENYRRGEPPNPSALTGLAQGIETKTRQAQRDALTTAESLLRQIRDVSKLDVLEQRRSRLVLARQFLRAGTRAGALGNRAAEAEARAAAARHAQEAGLAVTAESISEQQLVNALNAIRRQQSNRLANVIATTAREIESAVSEFDRGNVGGAAEIGRRLGLAVSETMQPEQMEKVLSRARTFIRGYMRTLQLYPENTKLSQQAAITTLNQTVARETKMKETAEVVRRTTGVDIPPSRIAEIAEGNLRNVPPGLTNRNFLQQLSNTLTR